MGKRVLIVDDSSLMRKVIAKTLAEHGHTVVGEAKSGREAVEMYKVLRPQAVTMDITMREMDGLSAAREILSFDAGARIIIVSNLDREKYGKQAERIGAMGFVAKQQDREFLALLESL